MPNLTKAQIGASGVLLIQYRLLKCGIETAPMTTDAGIDLVAYSSVLSRAVTVQVKACLKPKLAGGTGRLSLDWWLPRNSPAEMIGVVNLATDQAWLLTKAEFARKAQQETPNKWHLCMLVEPDYFPPPNARTRHEREFAMFRIEDRTRELFGPPLRDLEET